MHVRLRPIAAAAVGLAACLAFALPATAQPAGGAQLQRGFFGLQGWTHPEGSELQSLQRAGIGSVRVGFNRAAVLDRNGDPHWAELDKLVADAAQTGIELLPVLSSAPYADGQHRARPPLSRPALLEWEHWVEEVVARYGPGGGFWYANPTVTYLPVRAWQVWNEPNLRGHWPRPDPRAYVALLRATSRAIRYMDPSATVVLAGIPDTDWGIPILRYFRSLYRQRGFADLFDVIAFHPYARTVPRIGKEIRSVRAIMRRHQDLGRPTWITEIGWATSGPDRSRFRVSVDDQARRLRNAYGLFIGLRRRWSLERVYWFSLRDRDLLDWENDWFGPHTGLFYRSGYAKPAWLELARLAGGTADEWLGGRGTTPPVDDCESQIECD